MERLTLQSVSQSDLRMIEESYGEVSAERRSGLKKITWALPARKEGHEGHGSLAGTHRRNKGKKLAAVVFEISRLSGHHHTHTRAQAGTSIMDKCPGKRTKLVDNAGVCAGVNR